MANPEFTSLVTATTELRALPGSGDMLSRFRESRTAINNELRSAVLGAIPAFMDSGNPEIVPELANHGAAHTEEIIRLLSGEPVSGFDFVREHSYRRAEQRFPLEATLHAYRVGHKVFMRGLRQAFDADGGPVGPRERINELIADFAIEYVDAVSSVATAAYVARTRLLADDAVDQRADLLNLLLDGYDESDRRASTVLRRGGYLDSRQSFCVALARSVEPGEMRMMARARRLADSVDNEFRHTPIRRLVDVRDNHAVIIFSANRRASGWTAPSTRLADQVIAHAKRLGNAVLVGVSNDVPSTSGIPLAYRQAQVALEFASVTSRVQPYATLPLHRLLLFFAADKMSAAVPAWADELRAADAAANGNLSRTLLAYAEHHMNATVASQKLAVHTNTIYARFQRITDITALDPKQFLDLMTLVLVAQWFEMTE